MLFMSTKLHKVIFMCGAGHSGSTLLGHLLGNLDNCFYGGELKNTQFLENKNIKATKRVCKICGENCSVWSKFQLLENENIYEKLADLTQNNIIVDSTKDSKWTEKQINTLQKKNVETNLIFVQRNGKAVFNSRLRKQKATPHEILERWKTDIKNAFTIFENFKEKKYILKYENLCLNPENEIDNLCNTLEISNKNLVSHLFQKIQHPLGGNNGTHYLAAKNSSPLIYNQLLSEKNKTYYQNHSNSIIADNRWETELSEENIFLFEQLAAETNKLMNY